ncbi:MAG: hypothetical protein ACREQ5_16645 [Candidatus Dormibacteria bacterium]
MTEFVAKRKKLLTRPVLKYVVDSAIYVKIETEMHIGKEMKPGPDGKKKEPATLCNVIDLKTGEPSQIIANAVVKSVLLEEYPNSSYVGLCFAITKQARVQGKQYDPFNIEEIEDPAAESSVVKHQEQNKKR